MGILKEVTRPFHKLDSAILAFAYSLLFLPTISTVSQAQQNVSPGNTSASLPQFRSEELYARVLPSIATLHVEKKDGRKVTGTAFLALREGVAVTAWHVVENAQRVSAKFSDGEEFEVSGMIDRDPVRDVVLIRVKVFGRPLLALASREPSVGSQAYAIGSPLGLDFSISDGLFSQIRKTSASSENSDTTSSGNSGTADRGRRR